MKTTTRVCVIGGGVVGCSVLYHLTKLGWSDVMLLERSELTSGSTWHAAGGFHTLNGDTNMAALQGYTIKLYRELEKLTSLSCGLHHVGAITLADNQDRFDMLVAERAKHRYMGLETMIIGPEEIAKIAPITNTEGVIGGLYDPLDGHLDPSGTTHAYAKAARMGGATIETHCMVQETNQRPDGTWDVVTNKGTIHAEHIVNAGGLWAREVGAMAGVYMPLHPMEHQYLVTENIPMIEEMIDSGIEHPHVMDPAGESYLRQEARGLCIGFYEQTCRPWAVDGTSWDFGHELLPDDFDKIEASVDFAYKRFPFTGARGCEIGHPRPLHLCTRWQPIGGARAWHAQLLVCLCSYGRVQPRRWRWPDPRAMDDRGRTRAGCLCHGLCALRQMDHPRLHSRPKVIENYQRRFSVCLSKRRTPCVSPVPNHPSL